MNNLIELQSYQPDYYMNFVEMQEILKSQSTQLDKIETELQIMRDNYFLDTLTDYGVKHWKDIMNIPTEINKSIVEYRSNIQSIKRGLGKFNATTIKQIAQSYNNGVVEVSFSNSTIKISYLSLLGVPTNFSTFQSIISRLKPAHLNLEFEFKYNTWDEAKVKTWSQLKPKTWDQVKSTSLA